MKMKLKSFYGHKNEDSSANIDITQSGNSSLGLNISAVLNDSDICNASEVLSLSGIAGLLENEGVIERSNRPIKRKDYNEGEDSDIRLSDDDTGDHTYCPSDDGENLFVPRKKKTKSENNGAGKSANVLQSTSKPKGPGRPRGSKNKIKTSTRKQGKKQGQKANVNPQNLVDDTENILSKEANAKFRNNSNTETGCTSPVKKKNENARKTRKPVREPKNWGKNFRKTARNTGK